jgi:hypothetical protein
MDSDSPITLIISSQPCLHLAKAAKACLLPQKQSPAGKSNKSLPLLISCRQKLTSCRKKQSPPAGKSNKSLPPADKSVKPALSGEIACKLCANLWVGVGQSLFCACQSTFAFHHGLSARLLPAKAAKTCLPPASCPDLQPLASASRTALHYAACFNQNNWIIDTTMCPGLDNRECESKLEENMHQDSPWLASNRGEGAKTQAHS